MSNNGTMQHNTTQFHSCIQEIYTEHLLCTCNKIDRYNLSNKINKYNLTGTMIQPCEKGLQLLICPTNTSPELEF
jgi:hypothetical protein